VQENQRAQSDDNSKRKSQAVEKGVMERKKIEMETGWSRKTNEEFKRKTQEFLTPLEESYSEKALVGLRGGCSGGKAERNIES